VYSSSTPPASNDLNALSKFEHVLPPRNDADLRQGLRFVHLAPQLLDTLRGGRDLDDDRGYLSSSSVLGGHLLTARVNLPTPIGTP
jgi:hypothetical protein